MRVHLAIPVKDLAVSQKFYESLGLAYVNTWEKSDQELKAVVMENDTGTRLELVFHPANGDAVFPQIAEVLHIGLSVPAIGPLLEEKEVIKPITKGISVKEFAFIRDPNGFPVELVVEKYEPQT